MPVGPGVPHHPDARGVGQDREILARTNARFFKFTAEDRVGVAKHVRPLPRDLPDDPHGKSGTREGLARDERFGQSEFPSDLAHLVLEEVAERLDDPLKFHHRRKPADVVVALDGGGVALAALDDVGVDGPLHENIGVSDLVAHVFKDADELLPDDLALLFGFDDAREFR